MGITVTEGDERSASHIEQEEQRCTRCRAGLPRREVPTGMMLSRRIVRGEGVIVNAQMCR